MGNGNGNNYISARYLSKYGIDAELVQKCGSHWWYGLKRGKKIVNVSQGDGITLLLSNNPEEMATCASKYLREFNL